VHKFTSNKFPGAGELQGQIRTERPGSRAFASNTSSFNVDDTSHPQLTHNGVAIGKDRALGYVACCMKG
jgi:hypothetical protein